MLKHLCIEEFGHHCFRNWHVVCCYWALTLINDDVGYDQYDFFYKKRQYIYIWKSLFKKMFPNAIEIKSQRRYGTSHHRHLEYLFNSLFRLPKTHQSSTVTDMSSGNLQWLMGSDLFPDIKVHGANMGPTWVLSAAGGPHMGLMNLAIWDPYSMSWNFLKKRDKPTAKWKYPRKLKIETIIPLTHHYRDVTWGLRRFESPEIRFYVETCIIKWMKIWFHFLERLSENQDVC